MPFRPIKPQQRAPINPRPRIRRVPVSTGTSTTSGRDADTPVATPRTKEPHDSPIKKKRQPTGDYLVGYCRTPEETRFKERNAGGPGRPKGSRSQDSITREALSQTHVVSSGGRARKVTTRQLANTLMIKEALEKRRPRDLQYIIAEARRLFPEPVVADDIANHDDALGLDVVKQFMTIMTLGEAVSGVDPSGDFTAPTFGPRRIGDAVIWSSDDQAAGHMETTDED